MERRSAVEIWAELGFLGKSGTPKIKCGTNIYISNGSDEVYIFSVNEKNLKIILQFFAPVYDLLESCDKQLLFVACRTGVCCINVQSLLQRYQGSSSPAEVKISSEFLVVEADGVSSLLLVGSVLLTLSKRDESWLLTLYKKPKETCLTSCEVLSSFCLPLISSVVQEEAKLKARHTEKSVLICVHCGDEPSSSTGETDMSYSHVHLEPLLFKLLFGVEAALIRSPVIVFGLPDGRLCYLPLRLPGSRLRVLYSLEQPVVFVGASVVMETDPGHARGLVVVGEQGRVVLIKTDRARTERGFTEGCVPGPVVCGCVDKNFLYYSTGSDLLTLNLSEGSAEREDRERDEEVLQSPTSLNVCRLIALNEPTCDTAGEVKLFGLSVSGQLQSIRPPGQRRQDEGLSELPSPQVGRSVRDLLSAIGDVFERASLLKTIIKSKNQTLRELNQVVNISFMLTASGETGESFPVEGNLIKCRSTARWSSLLQKNSLNLTCVLDNSSPYVLDRGWTLSISISPLCSSSNTRMETSSENFSVPFHSLRPGESFEVTLPIAAASATLFPLTVTCSLIFSLSSFLGEEEMLSSAGLQSSCFTLPLNTLTVDWLHTVQIISPTADCKMATFRSNATDAIQALLNSRHMRCGGEDGASTQDKYSARVQLSSQLLRDTLMSKSCNVDTKGSESSQTLCSSLLDWLLYEDHGGVKMGHKLDKNHTLVIHARALNEATVKLTAKEVNVEEVNPRMEEEARISIEVQIESSSMVAVCGLHHAVLCRIQSLLKKAPEEAASTRKVLSLGLRRALQRAEILQTQISEALSVGASSGHANRFLLGFYRDLRENSLLII